MRTLATHATPDETSGSGLQWPSAFRRAYGYGQVPVFSLSLLLLLAAPSAAQAQTQAAPPDAGVISSQTLNQQRRALEEAPAPQEDEAAVTGTREESASPMPDSAVRFELRAVEFDPSEFLTSDELAGVAEPYVGTEVGFPDLNAIAQGVNALYDQLGLVTARAVLLPQTIEGGTVRISLIEGAVGAVEVDTADQLSAEEAIRRSGLEAGEILDTRKLERRLSLINRTNPVQIRAGLKPGEQFGLTDIQLAVVAPEANLLQVFADNHGFDTVGQWQGGGYYRRTGLIGASDRLSAYVAASEGALSGTVAYDAAILGPTTRLGLSYGRSRSEIVNGPFAVVGSVGKTENVALNYSQPIASSSTELLLASLTAGTSNTRNFASGVFVNAVRTNKAGAGLSYSYLAPGFSVQANVNTLIARASLIGNADKTTFGVFSGTVFAEKRLDATFGIRGFAGWQATSSNGVPGDILFQIGGASTVRGYEQSALSGDGGYYLNAEVDAKVADGFNLFAFADHGRIFTQRVQEKTITAVGAGLSLSLLKHLSIRATGGLPLRRLAGQSRDPRFFLRAQLQF